MECKNSHKTHMTLDNTEIRWFSFCTTLFWGGSAKTNVKLIFALITLNNLKLSWTANRHKNSACRVIFPSTEKSCIKMKNPVIVEITGFYWSRWSQGLITSTSYHKPVCRYYNRFCGVFWWYYSLSFSSLLSPIFHYICSSC